MEELQIRKPYVAGQFYDGNPQRLQQQINEMADEVRDTVTMHDHPRAIIVPHAGYVYSARTAIKAFLACGNSQFARAIVISPSHRVPFEGLALCTYDQLETPLGMIDVDKETLPAQRPRYAQVMNQAHASEHALEVELPLLQSFLPSMPVVPLVCGHHLSQECLDALTTWLSPLWNNDTLWIISSDFTHFGASFGYLPFHDNIPERLHELDHGAIEYICKLDSTGFAAYVEKTGATICGANPIRLLLSVASKAKDQGQELSVDIADYTTSGALTGDYTHCVSYASLVLHSG